MSEELSDKKPLVQQDIKTPRNVLSRVVLSVGIIVGGVLSFITTQIIAAVIVGIIFGSVFGLEASRIDDLFSNNAVILVMYLLSSFLLVGILVGVAKLTKKGFLQLIGLARKPGWSDLAWAFLAYGVYFVCFALIATVLVPLFDQVIDVNQQQDLGVNLDFNASNAVVLFIMFVVIPPIIEEILFRGFIYRSVRKLMPRWLAVGIVSIVFGAMHLELLSGNSPNWIAMVDTTVLSVVLIVLVEKTGSLWSSIYLHAFKNLIAFTLLLSGLV